MEYQQPMIPEQQPVMVPGVSMEIGMNHHHQQQQQQQQPIPNYMNGPQSVPFMDKAPMWPNHYYDSGVISNISTNTPSVSGYENDLDDPSLNFEDVNIFDTFDDVFADNNQPVATLNHELSQTRLQQAQALQPIVEQPIFTDPMNETMETMDVTITNHQYTPTAAAQSEVMADPIESSNMLENAVVNLIRCQDDADLSTRAIPELIILLNDQDQVVVDQTTLIVYQLSKKETGLNAIMNSPAMVSSLVKAVSQSNDIDTIKCAAGILHNLSQHQQGLWAIFKSNGILALVKLLSSQVESVLFYAITTLHNLLLHQEGSKVAVRHSGGLQMMVSLLRRDNFKFLAIVTDCLQILAYGNQDAKLIILECGGPVELVRIMRTYDHEKLLWTTSRVLKVLSVCSNNKPAIVNCGGMQALATHLTHQSQRLMLNCLWTLRNLSDAATRCDNLKPLLQNLVQLLTTSEVNIVTCAAGILSNLTCNNQMNKSIVMQVGGIEALIRTIFQAGNHDEIIEPAICALRHLTSRHAESDIAQNAVRLHCGLPIIVDLLNQSKRWSLIKAVIGLLRNLILCSSNHGPLRECGAVPILFQLLNKANQLASGNEQFQSDHIEDVCMNDIVQSMLAVLHVLDQNVVH